MAVQHLQRSASSELPVKLAAFVQAHPANGGQQPQLAVDYLKVTHGAEAQRSIRSPQVTRSGVPKRQAGLRQNLALWPTKMTCSRSPLAIFVLPEAT